MIVDFINAAEEFNNNFKQDENSRYRSWQHCYKNFYQARQKMLSDADYDYLSLQLYQYLASWGMLRASFLLWKDYKVHIETVKKILEPKYDCLQGVTCRAFQDEKVIAAWKDLNNELSNIYGRIRSNVKNKGSVKSKISSVLLSKILLGTLGCSPAYDRFFVAMVKKHLKKDKIGTYGIDSIVELSEFYQKHYDKLEQFRQNLDFDFEGVRIPYPQMKLLDMGFWKLGFRDNEEYEDRENYNK